MLSIEKAIAGAPRRTGRDWDDPFQRYTRALGGFVLVVGIFVLILSLSEGPALTRLSPNGSLMNANAALGITLLGALLYLHARPKAPQLVCCWCTVLAILVALLGVGTGLEYLFGLDLGFSRVVVTESSSFEAAYRGRISELSAIGFTLLGCAFLGVDARDPRLQAFARFLAEVTFAIGYVGVLGHLFEAQQLYHFGAGPPLSLHAAISFVIVAIAFLLARPTRGLAHVLTQDDVRGMLLRRLWPTVLFAAPLIGWLQAKAALNPGTADSVLIVLGTVVLLALLIWWAAKTIQTATAARAHAEANVKTSEERLQWALQAAGGGAWDWDLTHDKAWWSPDMYALWRVDPRTIMHFENSMTLIDERDREQVKATLQQAMATRSTYRCEFRVASRNGEERWMESRGRACFDATGNVVRLLGITIDITAQKKVELSLRHANKTLEQNNVELQRFAYVASHDLQTPLRTVTSFAELLQTRYEQTLPSEAKTWLGRILCSVEKLQSLVGDLLQYSRVESQTRSFARVSMEEAFASAMQVLDEPLRSSDATIEHSPLPDVHGDATQLIGVLLNLLDNAVKYRRDEPPRITVSVEALDREWSFCVADNGIGIEERHYERIFEMFERLHCASEYPGTGIGLAICRRVIHRHGGRIWVESVLGQGSKFSFTLPRDPSEPATRAVR